MKRTLLFFALWLLAASCKTPDGPAIIDGGGGGKELPVVATYATEDLSLAATVRDNWQIYQVNLKLYGNSGAFGKVQERLDFIKSLGTEILYLMPVYKEGKKNAIGSPYCIQNYTEVESMYGTLDQLKALVQAAHNKGMKVMFDWVANHTAWDHPWITEHPDWYEHKADGSIAWPTKDGEWKDVAQLDYSKKELWTAMENALLYWVTELDIDGYRCDYAHGVRDDFWKEAISKLKAQKSGFIMLAESDFERMFDDGFDIIFDRAMKSRMINLYNNGNVTTFTNWYKEDQGKAPAPKTKLYFVTNHDDATENTPPTQFKSADGALSAYVLMAALNGSAMIYGSQETAYNQKINFFNVQTFNWAANADYQKKYQDAMAALAKVNRGTACKIYHSDKVVFVHYAPTTSSKGSLVAVNVSGSSVSADFPQPVSGKGSVPTKQTFSAYQYQIWEID